MDHLTVSEIFGPTVQGEGPSCGRRAAFVRLGLCNLDCSWCDTPYTWDWTGKNGPPQDRSALVQMTQAEVLDKVLDLDDVTPAGIDRVVITGGEPMLQRVGLGPLVTMLHRQDVYVEVETNGTITPTDHLLDVVDQWNVSPKLHHAGPGKAEEGWHVRPLVALAETGRAVLKVVCRTAEDVDMVASSVDIFQIPFAPCDVWIMPEGIDAATIGAHTQAIAETAIARGYNLTSRLHVMVWGNKRGV